MLAFLAPYWQQKQYVAVIKCKISLFKWVRGTRFHIFTTPKFASASALHFVEGPRDYDMVGCMTRGFCLLA